MNRRGAALIISFMVIVVLTILSSAVIARSVSERFIAQRYAESMQAFWLAEAGVSQALNGLRSTFNVSVSLNPKWSGTLSTGQYEVFVVANIDSENTKIASHGYVPTKTGARAERVLEAIMNKFIKVPPNFYNNVIYSAGGIVKSGNPTVTGIEYNASPLPLLDFEQLRTISQSQNNYHDADHLDGPFPSSFWYDQTKGIPNVVFLEGSLNLSGKKDQVGGFFVVGGDVIYDATIGGNAAIDGAVYTRGGFTINGGGSVPFNVNGGIWSGGQATLNGSSVTVAYNETYMSAIKELGINTDVQMTDWRDRQNP